MPPVAEQVNPDTVQLMEPAVKIAPREVVPATTKGDESRGKISLLLGVSAAAAAAAILTIGIAHTHPSETPAKATVETRIAELASQQTGGYSPSDEFTSEKVTSKPGYSNIPSGEYGQEGETYFVYQQGSLAYLASYMVEPFYDMCPISTLEWQQAYKDITSVKRVGDIHVACFQGNWGLSVETKDKTPKTKTIKLNNKTFVDRGPAYAAER
jgi:hypothetical protein